MTALEAVQQIERILGLHPGEIFIELSEQAQAECWAELGDRQHRLNRFLACGDEPCERPERDLRAVPARRSPRTRVDRDREQDPILRYPLQIAFKVLTGQPVPQSGMVRCPAPGHKDRRPSCRIGDSLFFCFSCKVSGSLYDLGALLSGIPARGESFFELRKWLAMNLLVARR